MMRARFFSAFFVLVYFWLPISLAAADEVTTLSERDPRYKLLEELQRAICSASPTHRCDVSPSECEKNILGDLTSETRGTPSAADAEQYVKGVCGVRGTPYEIPGYHWLLTNYIQSVSRTAERLGLSVPKNVVYGGLPLPSVNAEVQVRSRENASLVLINFRLISFATEFSELVAQTIPYKLTEKDIHHFDLSEEASIQRIQETPQLRTKLLELIDWFQEGVIPRKTKAEGEMVGAVSHAYAQAILMFAVAHEIGHLFHGHSSSNFDWARLGSEVRKLFERGRSSMATSLKEIEADVFATSILLSQRQEPSPATPNLNVLRLHGIELYFIARLVMEDARRISKDHNHLRPPPEWFSLNEGDLSKLTNCVLRPGCRARDIRGLSRTARLIESHPSPWFRANLARTVMREVPLEPSSEWSPIGDAMTRNAALLWDMTRDEFAERAFRKEMFLGVDVPFVITR
jgi:hypothetical protein